MFGQRLLLTLLAVLTLMLGGVSPAQAQDNDTVTKTFRLTLHGDVPANPADRPSFLVDYAAFESDGDVIEDRTLLCDGGSSPAVPDCASGSVYTTSVEAETGSEISFSFEKLCNPGTRRERPFYIHSGVELLTQDLTNPAWYDYESGQGGPGDAPGEEPPDPNNQPGSCEDIPEMVEKTFELTLYGDAPRGENFDLDVRILEFGDPDEEDGFDGFGKVLCGPSIGTACAGGGAVYAIREMFSAGTVIRFEISRRIGESEMEGDVFAAGTETLDAHMTNAVWYDFDHGTGGLGERPVTDDQQGGAKPTVPDNQQTGGEKDTHAGDDQQDTATGAGKTPDNQQGGGGATVTKTFELTINGMVPADQAFSVGYGQRGEEGTLLVFCGDPQSELAESQPPCKAGVYTRSVEVTAGTTIGFSFIRTDPGTDEVFHSGTETISADMTNTAWYAFDKDTAASDVHDETQDADKDSSTGTDDDQQSDVDKDIGAGDDQPDDTQDDLQDKVPDRLPETGAGGLAPNATISISNAIAALALLVGAGYTVVRRL